MTKTIEIKCCEGDEQYAGQCLKTKCPWYGAASQEVDRRWPRMSTGFGNAYDEPKHHDYLDQVQADTKKGEKKVE